MPQDRSANVDFEEHTYIFCKHTRTNNPQGCVTLVCRKLMRWYSINKSLSVKCFLKNRCFGCITLLQCHQIEAQSFHTVVRRTVSLVAFWRVKTCKFEFCWSVLDCKTFFPLNSSYVLWKVVGAGKKGNVIYFFVFVFQNNNKDSVSITHCKLRV